MKEKKRGFSFGLGRGDVQKLGHEESVAAFKHVPGPSNPRFIGKELATDASAFTMAKKSTVDIEMKTKLNVPSPDQY